MTTFYTTTKGRTAHVIDPDNHRLTFCARKATKSRGSYSNVRPPTLRPCKHCYVSAMRRLVFPFEDDYTVDEKAVAKSLTIDSRTIIEIDARVFTVEGSSGMYVVVLGNGLNPICNCMAGKTNPTVMCKHVARVLTVTNGLNHGSGEVGVRRVS